MAIWFNKDLTLTHIGELGKGTMSEHLGIEWKELGDNYLKATMPVDHRTRQAYGLLHGGASCVLAESIGTVASAMVIDPAKYYCAGLEINANHVRSAKEGFVNGTASPLHLGSTTHVWDIKIRDEQEKLICVCRLTVIIIPRKQVTDVSQSV